MASLIDRHSAFKMHASNTLLVSCTVLLKTLPGAQARPKTYSLSLLLLLRLSDPWHHSVSPNTKIYVTLSPSPVLRCHLGPCHHTAPRPWLHQPFTASPWLRENLTLHVGLRPEVPGLHSSLLSSLPSMASSSALWTHWALSRNSLLEFCIRNILICLESWFPSCRPNFFCSFSVLPPGTFFRGACERRAGT